MHCTFYFWHCTVWVCTATGYESCYLTSSNFMCQSWLLTTFKCPIDRKLVETFSNCLKGRLHLWRITLQWLQCFQNIIGLDTEQCFQHGNHWEREYVWWNWARMLFKFCCDSLFYISVQRSNYFWCYLLYKKDTQYRDRHFLIELCKP